MDVNPWEGFLVETPLSLIGCPNCGQFALFELAYQVSAVCAACRRSFPMGDGILALLPDEALRGEAAVEAAQRDVEVLSGTNGADQDDRAAIARRTIAAIDPDGGALLELGCGEGFYTGLLANAFPTIVAVDYSAEALRRLAARVDTSRVLLVRADATSLRVKPGAFSRVFSTLTSQLPTPEALRAVTALAASALGAGGKYIFSAHNFGWPRGLAGVQKVGRYDNGIFRRLFDPAELRDLASDYFGSVGVQHVGAAFRGAGLARRILGESLTETVGTSLPGLREWSDLLLATAGVR